MNRADTEKENFITIFDSIDFHRIKDHPNILIAARFWENERYHAAKVCYKFMRAIDDLIDDYKTEYGNIVPGEQEGFRRKVEEWLKRLISSAENNPLHDELAEIVHTFRIPVWPMEAFAESMVYDIYNDGFLVLDSFLNYARGASVAPASIFVHLSGLTRINGMYQVPQFNVKEVATPCAIFSYLVHIVRDFQKDQLSNLNYFADDLILKYNLTRKELRDFAEGVPVNSDFRRMIGEYHQLADRYRLETYHMLQKIRPLVEPRYQLSLEIIFNLYLLVFEKINVTNGRFTTEELNPSPEETRERVLKTILNFRAV
jgi:phytoene/squalene synthetase